MAQFSIEFNRKLYLRSTRLPLWWNYYTNQLLVNHANMVDLHLLVPTLVSLSNRVKGWNNWVTNWQRVRKKDRHTYRQTDRQSDWLTDWLKQTVLTKSPDVRFTAKLGVKNDLRGCPFYWKLGAFWCSVLIIDDVSAKATSSSVYYRYWSMDDWLSGLKVINCLHTSLGALSLFIAELRRPEGPHTHIGKKRKPMNWFSRGYHG